MTVTWTRSNYGPVYETTLTRGRTAKLVKTRTPGGFTWVATVRTPLGAEYRVCRENTLTAARKAFIACVQRGITQYGQDFTL